MKTTKKDFRKELGKLIAKHEDSVLAKYIENCLKQHDQNNQPQENPYGVDLNKIPQQPSNQPIPASIGNTVSTGWSNPFAGTSWGM